MRPFIAAFGAGLIFALGLGISGMTDPGKVIAFLDVAGRWDASLAFVMAGAIAVSAVGFRVAAGHAKAVCGTPIELPATQRIDARLVGGSLLFGVGWGLAGFCPGPGLVALGMGEAKAAIFVAAMLAGMGLFELIERLRRQRPAPLAEV